MKKSSKQLLLWVILASLNVALSLLGQTNTGSITGRIVDPSQAVVPDARVTATNVDTAVERRTTSNHEGIYALPLLPPGNYQVAVQAEGFRPVSHSGVQLIVNQTVRMDFVLELGTVAEAIQVSATVNQIQTENSKIISAVTNKMVDELPLVVGGAMRSPFDLAVITPEANQPEGVGSADTSLNIGGGQGSAYGATLDGVSVLSTSSNRISWAALNTPSVDAITEFAVESNGFKAEYGRAQGGMIMFSSKSGTNELHGTAYEFLRNDALDSRRFFEDNKGVYKQHDFGWSLGGPVYIPKLYDGRNKTFFFTSMEWFRNRAGATSQRFSVPTPEMYQGDFSNWVDGRGAFLPVYDPATTRPNPNGAGSIRNPFPGNLIPANRFANFSQNVLKVLGNSVFPNVNAAPGTSDYVRDNFINTTGTVRSPWIKVSAKADHNVSLKDRVSFLYNYSLQENVPGADGFPGLPGIANNVVADRRDSPIYRASYTRVISPTIVNYAYGGGNGYMESHRSPNQTGGWKAKGVCLQNVWDCDATFPQISFSDFATWGGSGITGSRNTVYSFGDDLTITRGQHTLKMGYLYERLHYYGGPANNAANRAISGWLTFDRRSTSVPNNNNLSAGGGNAFASFVLGETFAGRIESPKTNGLQWKSHAWYLQDDWRLTQRLTFNVGVRYEFTLPPTEQADELSDFTPDKPNPSIGRSFGVAKTNSGTSHFDGFVLVAQPTSTDNGITPAFHADDGFPVYTWPPIIDPAYNNGQATPYWDDSPARLPEDYQWTFSIQRQVSTSTVLEVSYNATIGAHLLAYLKNYNQLPFGMYQALGRSLLASTVGSPAANAGGITRPYPTIDNDFGGKPVSVAQALRPFPQFQSINTGGGQGDKSGHSSYHSMVLKLDRRFSGGFNFQGSYVLSKTLTDADRYDGGSAALDSYNRRLEKSIGLFDQTHNFKFSYVYELPFGKGKRWMNQGAVGSLLGDWRIAGIQFYSSGFPIGLSNSINYLIFNGRSAAQISTYDNWIANNQNPDWKGNDRFFQPAEFFGAQSTGVLGNATRFNPKARTPWNLSENFSLAKSFTFTEQLRLDFRWEIFNAFNRSRFATGSTNVESPSFGKVTSTVNDPRRMQFGLKLYW
jgi:hypothetical protein